MRLSIMNPTIKNKKAQMIHTYILLSLWTVSYGHLLGAPQVIAEDANADTNPGLAHAVQWAAARITGHNANSHLVFKGFTHGTQQVVQGMKYVINLEFEQMDCPSHLSDPTLCRLLPTSSVLCTATVWSRSWLKNPQERTKLLDCNCDCHDCCPES